MTISRKEYDRLREIEKDSKKGLSFHALELIIRSCDFDAEKIGRHFLECYYKQKKKRSCEWLNQFEELRSGR